MFHHYASALCVSAQQYCINFKAASHFRERELHFFNKLLKGSLRDFLEKPGRPAYIMVLSVQ